MELRGVRRRAAHSEPDRKGGSSAAGPRCSLGAATVREPVLTQIVGLAKLLADLRLNGPQKDAHAFDFLIQCVLKVPTRRTPRLKSDL